MRHDARAQAYSDAFNALGKHEGEAHGQGEGFTLAAVVAELPGSELLVVQHFKSELAEAGFNVTRSRSAVAGAHIAPVTLGFNEEFFLANVNKCVADGRIAVRVISHGRTDNVCDLVETTVVHFLHGMKDAALHRFETVAQRRNSAFHDYIARVIDEPGLEQSAYRLDIRMAITDGGGAFFFGVLYVVDWIQGLTAKQSNCPALPIFTFAHLHRRPWRAVPATFVVALPRLQFPLVVALLSNFPMLFNPFPFPPGYFLQNNCHLRPGFLRIDFQTAYDMEQRIRMFTAL